MKLYIRDVIKSNSFRNAINSKPQNELVLVYNGGLRHTFIENNLAITGIDHLKGLALRCQFIENGVNIYKNIEYTEFSKIPKNALFVDFDSLMQDCKFREKMLKAKIYEIMDNDYLGINIDDKFLDDLAYSGGNIFRFIQNILNNNFLNFI